MKIFRMKLLRKLSSRYPVISDIGSFLSFCLIIAGFLFLLMWGAAACKVDIDTQQEGFPCNPDGSCREGLVCVQGFCVLNMCNGVQCGPDERCFLGKCTVVDCEYRRCPEGMYCIDGDCVSADCADVVCEEGMACAQGVCYPTDCHGIDCGLGVCVDGKCVERSCVGVTCPDGEVCGFGECYPQECAEHCIPGEVCIDDICVEASCVGVECPEGTACGRGGCWEIDCADMACAEGEVCHRGECLPADCVGINCPAGSVCAAGECRSNTCPDIRCGLREVCDEESGKCIPDMCYGRICPDGERCAARGLCVPVSCGGTNCKTGEVCDIDGETCVVPSCYGIICGENEQCLRGECVPRVCDYRSCPEGFFCVDEQCLPVSCGGVLCPENETCAGGGCHPLYCDDLYCDGGVCVNGECVDRSCVGISCPEDWQCANGECYPEDCIDSCGIGEVCEDGECTQVSCVGIQCPAGMICDGGYCLVRCMIEGEIFFPGDLNPDNDCLECEPGAATEEWTPVEEGNSCSGDEYCIVETVCDGEGNCIDGRERDCSYLDDICIEGICDESLSQCVESYLPHGTECGDGGYCDGAGYCVEECIDDDDCGETITGEWSECVYDSVCDMSGEVCRDVTDYHCIDGECITETGEECDSDLCFRVTDGVECDDDGNDCTVHICESGECMIENLPFGEDCGIAGHCDGSGTCSEGCTIDDNFYPAGSVNPDNICERCDTAISWNEWSPRDGISCSTQDPCTGGTCSGGLCVPEPYCTGTDADCGCSSCMDCTSKNGWYNQGSSYACCDGNRACTCRDQEYRSFYCDGNECAFSVTDTREQKTVCNDCDDENECTENDCDEGVCQTQNVDEGTLCGITGECDGEGECSEGCVIDEIYYSSGTINPDNECERCNMNVSLDSWTPREGISCNTGDPCTGGTCNAGICVPEPYCEGIASDCGCIDCMDCSLQNGWYDHGVSYACCDEDSSCLCLDQKYRIYDCDDDECIFQVTDERTLVSGCETCDDGSTCTDSYCNEGICFNEYYCTGTDTDCGCTTCTDCTLQNGWFDDGQAYDCCIGGEICSCQNQVYRTYTCDETTCTYSVTNDQMNSSDCIPCDDGDPCTAGICIDNNCEHPPNCAGTAQECGCSICLDCTDMNGWYDHGSSYDCCYGNKACQCISQQYRTYTCDGIECVYSVTDTRTDRSDCSDCDDDNPCTDSFCNAGQCHHDAWCEGTNTSCGCAECENCTSQNGWVNIGNPYDCCNGDSACSCRDREFRTYSCDGNECVYTVTDTDTVYSGCNNCDDGNDCTQNWCDEGECDADNHPVGHSCGTAGECDGEGECSEGCIIEGEYYPNGTVNPDNVCQRCNTQNSTNSWSPRDGVNCDTGDPCTSGLCAGGSCLPTNYCEGTDMDCGCEECIDCTLQDGWYDYSDTYQCCDGDRACTCREEVYRVFTCSGTSCTSSIEDQRTQRFNCVTCDDGSLCTNSYCSDGICFDDPHCDGSSTQCGCTSCTNCTVYNGWYNIGSSYDCCDEGMLCKCQDQGYRSYYCDDTECKYEMTDERTLAGPCLLCDDSNPCTDSKCLDGACVHPPYCAGTDYNCGCFECDSCTKLSGWYYVGPVYACCDANWKCASCRDRENRLYTCNGTACEYTVVQMGITREDCVDCDDGNECITNWCNAGTCANTINLPGTPCGDNQVCNHTGQCVDCLSNAHCDDGNECTYNYCDTGPGVCLAINLPSGSPCGSGWFCDGFGNCVECLHNSDCPDDGNLCTSVQCSKKTNACITSNYGDGHDCGYTCSEWGECGTLYCPFDWQSRNCEDWRCSGGTCQVHSTYQELQECANTCNHQPGTGHCCEEAGVCEYCDASCFFCNEIYGTLPGPCEVMCPTSN